MILCKKTKNIKDKRFLFLTINIIMLLSSYHSFLGRIGEGFEALKSLASRKLETTTSTSNCSAGCLKCVGTSESSALCEICDLHQGWSNFF